MSGSMTDTTATTAKAEEGTSGTSSNTSPRDSIMNALAKPFVPAADLAPLNAAISITRRLAHQQILANVPIPPPGTHRETRRYYSTKPANLTWFVITYAVYLDLDPGAFFFILYLKAQKYWELTGGRTKFSDIIVGAFDLDMISERKQDLLLQHMLNWLRLKYTTAELHQCYIHWDLKVSEVCGVPNIWGVQKEPKSSLEDDAIGSDEIAPIGTGRLLGPCLPSKS